MSQPGLTSIKLGKYKLESEIGRGGMGVVFLGYDPVLDRRVAIKVLPPHLAWKKQFMTRFLREARVAAQLGHPNIVTIYDVGQEGDWYYFVMEYLEGQTLTEIIRRRGPFPPDAAIFILRRLARALNHAHQNGLVHRDVKPGNVIIGPQGRVTLTDFGIVRASQDTRLTTTGALVGTPEYMSPEQVKELDVDTRSDQFSLAVVAYEMLSGQTPFKAESIVATLFKVVFEPSPSIREARLDLPAEVETVLERAMAKDLEQRYAVSDSLCGGAGAGAGGGTGTRCSDPAQRGRSAGRYAHSNRRARGGSHIGLGRRSRPRASARGGQTGPPSRHLGWGAGRFGGAGAAGGGNAGAKSCRRQSYSDAPAHRNCDSD